MTKLLIVESPNKCATLRKILGSGWQVEASVGHITELARDGEGHLGFDIAQSGVNCRYVPRGERGAGVIKKLRGIAAKAEVVYLATDPDREGESISWHLVEQLNLKKFHRVTYTQITDAAVKAAIANPRSLDMPLVDAQKARQCLDKLVGFKLSGLVQNANAGKSAGRVQSAALHLVTERERQIQNFKPTPYWSLISEYGEGFKAAYLGAEAVKDQGEEDSQVDEAADPSEAKDTESKRITTEAEANRIVEIARKNPHQVIEFTGKQAQKAPPSALTTSALQQAAGVKYGFDSEMVMKIAQELFEGVNLPNGDRHGVITYHRTDSIDLSPEFCEEVQHWLSKHEPALVPEKVTRHKQKEGAQGAHEAIRPVEVALTPDVMKAYLTEPQYKVYSLIWQRAIASQCAPAKLEKSRAVIKSGSTFWEARGSVLKSPGYTKIWDNMGEDSQLPTLQQGQKLKVVKVTSTAKMTTPPGRYSEPQLVQLLEKLGIGRPSTFANIMKTLKDREYVKVQKKSLVPTLTGIKVDECLQKVFPLVLDTKFTATMEAVLDKIADGKQDWQQYLVRFNFDVFQPALQTSGVQFVAQARKKSNKPCPKCNNPLTELPFRKVVQSQVKHFLKCMDGCEDVVFFWKDREEKWVSKDEISAPPPPSKQTQFVCQCCGASLEEYGYQKDGLPKIMLRCSNAQSRKTICKNEVYFQSTKGGFWNPTRKAEPSTDQPTTKKAKSATTTATTGTKKKKVA